MCGRFTQSFTWQELHSLYRLTNPLVPNLQPSWNIAPNQDVGVIVNEDSGRIYKPMRWGLIPFWAKDEKIGHQLINARLEGAAAKPAFRSAWKERRCLVPASGFYEWRGFTPAGEKKTYKQPFYISRQDGVPLTFAGLWDRWGPDKLLTFTILTTEACEGIKDLHTRMPVILDPTGFDTWLGGGEPALCGDLDEAVKAVPVSPRMNKPSYNAPDCIEPLVA